MSDCSATWLRPHREAADFKVQKQFAAALSEIMHRTITPREVRGWECCHQRFRDPKNVPYDVLIAVLNAKLPKDKRLHEAALREHHRMDIQRRLAQEERAEFVIDIDPLRKAIQAFKDDGFGGYHSLLKAWGAENDMEQVLATIVDRIRAGEARELFQPFERAFNEFLAPAAKQDQYDRIWRLVEAVAQTCVIPGRRYQTGQRQNVEASQAWLMRIRLLAAQGFEINGLHNKGERELDDDLTFALQTHGVTRRQKPIQRVQDLVRALVERYDPERGEPPDPLEDTRGFDRYCGLLNASLDTSNVLPGLFFHLMTHPESEDVLDLLYEKLPGLMSFTGTRDAVLEEGLLLKESARLEFWIARWGFKTGHFDTKGPQKATPSEHETAFKKEATEMTAQENSAQKIEIKTGDGSPVNIQVAGDRSIQRMQQQTADTERVLQRLEQLLVATGKEPERPAALRSEIRKLQDEIEETGAVPEGMPARLEAARNGLSLGQETTTLLLNLQTLWHNLFGGVV